MWVLINYLKLLLALLMNSFSYNKTHEFDLSELVEENEMLGPIYTADGDAKYFLNLCNKVFFFF
jgi:hypothetical protein